jgi:hypothetical protein
MVFSGRLIMTPLLFIGLLILLFVWMIYYFLPRLSRDVPTRFETVMMTLCSRLAVDLSRCVGAHRPVKEKRR